MDKERFDRALNYLLQDTGVRLGAKQKEFIQGVRDGDDTASVVKLSKPPGATFVETLVAAVIMVSQPRGNIACFCKNQRQARERVTQLGQWLHLFVNSVEFSFEEVMRDASECIRIRNVLGADVIGAAYSTSGSVDASNYRGMGTSLKILFLAEAVDVPFLLPLSAIGATVIMMKKPDTVELEESEKKKKTTKE